MPTVTISVPRMLMEFTGAKRRFIVEAQTVLGALDAAQVAYPMLRVHLFDETGAVREHVQLFVNSTDSRELPSLEVPVKDGDEIVVLQAISGGRRGDRNGSLLSGRSLAFSGGSGPGRCRR